MLFVVLSQKAANGHRCARDPLAVVLVHFHLPCVTPYVEPSRGPKRLESFGRRMTGLRSLGAEHD